MVEQLERVLNAIEKEIKSENSIWDKEQLISVVKPEMEELYTHFKKGKNDWSKFKPINPAPVVPLYPLF